MQIYHNPRCSKSRQTLELINKKKIKVEIIDYLKHPPTQKTLKEILKKLNIQAEDLVRKGESTYKEKFKGKDISNSQWIKILTQNPKLIERPIVIKGNKAIIGRPPENVLSLL